MSAEDWADLSTELDCWQRALRTATFWWRDDDAVAPSAELDRLLTFSGRVPVALAVIPALAIPQLAERLARESKVAVLQHGWRHENHGGPATKNEYPSTRLDEEVSSELAAGKARMRTLFGDRALRVFVPPFHGFDYRFAPLLATHGMAALSRFGACRNPDLAAGVREVNVHVSLFDWQRRCFGGDAPALRDIVAHLRGRRLGQWRSDEPTGVLTHHLVQDPPSYEFLERFLATTSAHPAARWLDARTVFA